MGSAQYNPSGGGSGAPTDATYLTQTASASLSAEQAMGALATGLVKNATTTGVQSIAAAGTDYVAPDVAIASGKTLIIDSATSKTNVPLQIAGDPNTGIGQVAGAGDTLSIVLGGLEALRWTGTSAGGQVGINVAGANTSGVTLQVNPHVTGSHSITLLKSASGGANTQLELTSSGNATVDLSSFSSGTAGNVFGTAKATSVALLAATNALFFIGGSGTSDVIFGANDTEIFRMDATNTKLKFAATSVSANGTGTVTTGNLAPGSTAVTIQEWMAVRTAGGARLIPLYG